MCESYTYIEILAAVALAVIGPGDWHDLALDWVRCKFDSPNK
jgi:hypothetical protein